MDNMKALIYLYFLKLKAQLRYYFRKLSSALLSLFLILVYGGIFLLAFLACDTSPMEMTSELSMSIMVVIGFLALMLFSTFLSKKKALFTSEDAYFLFSGPFSRSQVLSYLSFQTLTQGLMIEFFVIYMFSAMSMGLSYHWLFLLILIVGVHMVIVTFLTLTDYFYLVSIGEKKYKIAPYVIFGLFVVISLGILLTIYLQTGNIQTVFTHFIQSPLFYVLPFFGWLKLALVAFVEGKVLACLMGLGLLLVGLLISFMLLITYKGDFYEQALNDSIELGKITKEARKGNAFSPVKIKKQVKGDFGEGAYAILSKNILVMKKTNQWISRNDIMILGIYMVVTAFSNIGFGFFVYMLVLYIFSTLQQSSLYQELNNYRIYLIPDHPMKKLIAIILPTFIKVTVLSWFSLIVMGLYYQIGIMDLIYYCVILLGYICIFISSTILSLKVLKSRSSQVFENLFRMLLMVVCSLPSIGLTFFILKSGFYATWVMFILTYSSLIMNFVVSFAVLYFCKDMMNGRELKSD